jgi:hypothetical protein
VLRGGLSSYHSFLNREMQMQGVKVQECLIVDDDDVAKVAATPGPVREWRREDATQLKATRLFGGKKSWAGEPASNFPSAFQNYRPKAAGAGNLTGGMNTFPFAVNRGKGRAAAAAAPTPSGERSADPGTLLSTVKATFKIAEASAASEPPLARCYSPHTPTYMDGTPYAPEPPTLELS